MPPERLQKILAAAGVASRRKAEELIAEGRVSVNGQTVTEPGTKADPETDHIKVDGKPLRGAERHVYLMLNKPKGYVTTVSDPEGRPTVMEFVSSVEERIFPVGRLDYLTEGLLLLTNDGEFMQALTHAGSHVPKVYMVKVAGQPSEEELDKLRGGIVLPPEPTRAGTFGGTQPGMKRRSESVRTQPAKIELAKDQENPWYEVTLTEGRNRQIRRMFEQIGHHVEKIRRIRYGTLELGDLENGQFRPLYPSEVKQLRESLGKPFKILPPRHKQVDAASARPSRREVFGAARDRAEAAGRDMIRKREFRTQHPARDEREGGVRRFDNEGKMQPPEPVRERPQRADRKAKRFDRGERPAKRFDRTDRPTKQFDRGERAERPMRGDRPQRSERPFTRGDRPQRSERPFTRGDRPAYGERPPRTERPSRGDRPFSREDRPPRQDRGDRPPRRERPAFTDRRDSRGERPQRSERPFNRTERPPRGERPARGDRPFKRDDRRPGKFGIPAREGGFNKGEGRPRREGGFDRGPREGATGERPRTGGFGKKPGGFGGKRPGGFGGGRGGSKPGGFSGPKGRGGARPPRSGDRRGPKRDF